jgi:hypothetical protein
LADVAADEVADARISRVEVEVEETTWEAAAGVDLAVSDLVASAVAEVGAAVLVVGQEVAEDLDEDSVAKSDDVDS